MWETVYTGLLSQLKIQLTTNPDAYKSRSSEILTWKSDRQTWPVKTFYQQLLTVYEFYYKTIIDITSVNQTVRMASSHRSLFRFTAQQFYSVITPNGL